MNLILRTEVLLSLILLFLPALGNSENRLIVEKDKSALENLPESKKIEFRAVWIATINNIDWPSKPNLTVDEQKREFLQLLDTFEKFNLNVVILQVRAASDAFYQSKTEPWSRFLTGKQGLAPTPFYDPLEWAIRMCHQRGMELYAWFNPFRVRNLGYYQLDPKSFAAKHPEYVKEYDKKYFLDPGYPEVRDHVVEVISEVAHNYNVDAILLDDYFYPYPVEGKRFGDEKSFTKYGQGFFPKKIKEWRRENINKFVASLTESLHSIKPGIKFGISPFGIWRNKSVDPSGSSGLRATSSYDDLYADVRKWLVNGWIDFVIPQLYWEKGNHFGDFTSLVQWWSENSYGKPLYIGQALYKSTAGKNGWMLPDELNNQINFLRQNDKVKGFAFYSASNIGKLTENQVKALCENQLNSKAEINDDHRSVVLAKPVVTEPVADTIKSALLDAQIRKDFQLTLDYHPISIRPIWNSLSDFKPVLKKTSGARLLSWKAEPTISAQITALVAFKKTGTKRYRQTVIEFSRTEDFLLSEQRWKELKEFELLLVRKDLLTGNESYSSFFELKNRRVKLTDNPFKH